MKWLIPLVLVACDVRPLTSAELFGAPPPDAAAPDGPSLSDTPPSPDVAPTVPECRATNLNGSVSGDVHDDCDGTVIDALVGIGGKHTCSFTGKGSFHISGLPVGCDLFLTSKKDGYVGYGEAITIKPNGNSPLRIRLRREGPCPGPRPEPPRCVCTAPTCGPS